MRYRVEVHEPGKPDRTTEPMPLDYAVDFGKDVEALGGWVTIHREDWAGYR